ncbi:g2158 [Coccomyxa elongata]
MLQVLYDSLLGDPYIAPRVPPRLLDLLEYHKTLIYYDDDEEEYYDDDAEQQEAEELVEESWEPEQQEGGEVSGESPAEVTQPLTRLASAGTAACCLDDAFGSGDLAAAMEARSEPLDWTDRGQEGEEEEEEEEEPQLPEEEELMAVEEYGSPRETARDDASSCDEADYRSLLGSPLRAVPQADMKAAASPKRHGVSQPVIKITATSSTISSLNGPTIMYSLNETRDEARARLRGQQAAAKPGKYLAEAADRASAAARVSAAQAVAAAEAADRNAPSRHELGVLLDTMSTETGERTANAAAQAPSKALETVVEDTEAELARLNRSKVANMIKMYQGMEESQSRHTSPRIGARKSPVKFSEPLLPKHPIAMPDSPSKAEATTPRGYTSRYLSAVQAATNTVSTWLQRGGSGEVSSPLLAAATEQLRDEHSFKSNPCSELYDTNPIYDDMNERALWSPFNSSFSSEYCTFGGAAAKPQSRRNPELAARHAAAAARHAAAAARHANAAAKFAGLKLRTSPNGGYRRRSHAGNGPLYTNMMDTRTTDTEAMHFPENVMSTVDNMLFEP